MEFLIPILIVWFILCLLVGYLAQSKGRDAVGYFVLAFLFSPILTLIILLVVGDSDNKIQDKVRLEEEVKSNIRIENTRKEMDTLAFANKYENLERIGRLLEKGIISIEEFEKEKKSILSADHSNFRSIEILDHEKETFVSINNEILNARRSVLGSFNQELQDLLVKEFFERGQTIDLLNKYEELYKESLIEKIKKTSTNYTTIKKYLLPFINLKIVKSEFPHQRITNVPS